MYNILICDDEKDIVSAIEIYLKTAGYSVYKAYNGKEAVDMVNAKDIQLVLMDVMMPQMDGITAMAKIRENSNVPVIMLTAKSEDTDKVLGLEVGADDYVTKPFNPVELLARVKSQLRRYMQLGGGETPKDKLVIGGIELDDKSKQVTLDGEVMPLTPTEYDILKLLMQNVGKVFSTKEIYRAVWKEDRSSPLSTNNLLCFCNRFSGITPLRQPLPLQSQCSQHPQNQPLLPSALLPH